MTRLTSLLFVALASAGGVGAAGTIAGGFSGLPEAEPNDSRATATPFTPGDELSGVIGDAGDLDHFAADLQAGDVLEAEADFYGGTAGVSETEPNDALGQAMPVALGDTIEAVVDSAGDVDFFALHLDAHTPIDFDIDASVHGSRLDAVLTVFDPDGDSIAANDDSYAGDYRLDSRLQLTVPVSGTYRVRVRDWGSRGGSDYYYRLKLHARSLGPADPTEPLPGQPQASFGFVASGAGGNWLAGSQRIFRMAANGTITEVATDFEFAPFYYLREIVVDGFGDLLVSSWGVDPSGVFRVRPGGEVEVFIEHTVTALAVAPDRWIWYARDGDLYRMDPFGMSTEQVGQVPGTIWQIVFTPDGSPVVRRATSIDHIQPDGSLVRIHDFDWMAITDMEIDQSGRLYLASPIEAKLIRFDATFAVEDDPFATTYLESVRGVAFLRDDTNASLSRLIAVNGEVILVGPAGVAPGPDVGPTLIRADTVITAALMGHSYSHALSPWITGGSWSVMLGGLPDGLTLESDGTISGIPTESGEFELVARVETATTWGGARLRLRVDRPTIAVADAADSLLDGDALDENEVRFLDLQGNADGTYDAADFHAFVLSQDALPASPPVETTP